MINNWEQEMHEKYSDMYNHFYRTPTISVAGTITGPSFSSQWECNEWANYVEGRQNGTIKCPCCGKQMMSDKDCKDLEKTLDNLRGPNDLEEKVRVLEFRNAKLHQHNEKIEREIIELRNKIKELEHKQVDQFRNSGDL